jgi:hypothetical protein
MGYYTNYSLEVSELTPELDDFFEKETHDCGKRFYSRLLNYKSEGIKWYDHENDMIELSKKFPDILFILKGEGEDAEDLWVKYFLNGLMQLASARIEFEKFDPDKLRPL